MINLVQYDYPYHIFTLKAHCEECVVRDKSRGEKQIGEDSIRAVYKMTSRFNYGTIINTNGKSAKETLKKILSHLGER